MHRLAAILMILNPLLNLGSLATKAQIVEQQLALPNIGGGLMLFLPSFSPLDHFREVVMVVDIAIEQEGGILGVLAVEMFHPFKKSINYQTEENSFQRSPALFLR